MQPLSALSYSGSGVLQENVIFCQELIHSTRGMWPALWFLQHTRIQKLEVAQSQVCLCPAGCSSANSGEHPWNQVQAVHLSQASPVLNTGREMGFFWPGRACQRFSSLFNNQLPSRDLSNVVFVPLPVRLGAICSRQLRNRWRRGEAEQIQSI